MEDEPTENALALNQSDYVASAAKAALGAVPFAGSLLAEIAGTVIPNQRIDRIVRFAAELEKRLDSIEQDRLRAHLTNENFTDLTEEALRQAARSTTDERREYIATLVAKSITAGQVSFIEAKHLLRILGEINDIEVIWLRSYLDPARQRDEDFRSKHRNVLEPQVSTMDSTQAEIDQATLQRSYKEHLERLGLLRARYQMDTKTRAVKLDSGGRPEIQTYELTSLGRLLLRHVGFVDPLGG